MAALLGSHSNTIFALYVQLYGATSHSTRYEPDDFGANCLDIYDACPPDLLSFGCDECVRTWSSVWAHKAATRCEHVNALGLDEQKEWQLWPPRCLRLHSLGNSPGASYQRQNHLLPHSSYEDQPGTTSCEGSGPTSDIAGELPGLRKAGRSGS